MVGIALPPNFDIKHPGIDRIRYVHIVCHDANCDVPAQKLARGLSSQMYFLGSGVQLLDTCSESPISQLATLVSTGSRLFCGVDKFIPLRLFCHLLSCC